MSQTAFVEYESLLDHSFPTMKALALQKPGAIALEERQVPRAGAKEAVVRVTLTTICGN